MLDKIKVEEFKNLYEYLKNSYTCEETLKLLQRLRQINKTNVLLDYTLELCISNKYSHSITFDIVKKYNTLDLLVAIELSNLAKYDEVMKNNIETFLDDNAYKTLDSCLDLVTNIFNTDITFTASELASRLVIDGFVNNCISPILTCYNVECDNSKILLSLYLRNSLLAFLIDKFPSYPNLYLEIGKLQREYRSWFIHHSYPEVGLYRICSECLETNSEINNHYKVLLISYLSLLQRFEIMSTDNDLEQLIKLSSELNTFAYNNLKYIKVIS